MGGGVRVRSIPTVVAMIETFRSYQGDFKRRMIMRRPSGRQAALGAVVAVMLAGWGAAAPAWAHTVEPADPGTCTGDTSTVSGDLIQ